MALRRRQGQALALVLALFVCVLALVAIRGMLTDSDFRRGRHVIWHNQATYVAEAGLELAMAARQAGAPEPWVFDVGGHDVMVIEVAEGDSLSELKATAKVGEVTVERSLVLLPMHPRGGHP